MYFLRLSAIVFPVFVLSAIEVSWDQLIPWDEHIKSSSIATRPYPLSALYSYGKTMGPRTLLLKGIPRIGAIANFKTDHFTPKNGKLLIRSRQLSPESRLKLRIRYTLPHYLNCRSINDETQGLKREFPLEYSQPGKFQTHTLDWELEKILFCPSCGPIPSGVITLSFWVEANGQIINADQFGVEIQSIELNTSFPIQAVPPGRSDNPLFMRLQEERNQEIRWQRQHQELVSRLRVSNQFNALAGPLLSPQQTPQLLPKALAIYGQFSLEELQALNPDFEIKQLYRAYPFSEFHPITEEFSLERWRNTPTGEIRVFQGVVFSQSQNELAYYSLEQQRWIFLSGKRKNSDTTPLPDLFSHAVYRYFSKYYRYSDGEEVTSPIDHDHRLVHAGDHAFWINKQGKLILGDGDFCTTRELAFEWPPELKEKKTIRLQRLIASPDDQTILIECLMIDKRNKAVCIELSPPYRQARMKLPETPRGFENRNDLFDPGPGYDLMLLKTPGKPIKKADLDFAELPLEFNQQWNAWQKDSVRIGAFLCGGTPASRIVFLNLADLKQSQVFHGATKLLGLTPDRQGFYTKTMLGVFEVRPRLIPTLPELPAVYRYERQKPPLDQRQVITAIEADRPGVFNAKFEPGNDGRERLVITVKETVLNTTLTIHYRQPPNKLGYRLVFSGEPGFQVVNYNGDDSGYCVKLNSRTYRLASGFDHQVLSLLTDSQPEQIVLESITAIQEDYQ